MTATAIDLQQAIAIHPGQANSLHLTGMDGDSRLRSDRSCSHGSSSGDESVSRES